MIIVGFTIAFVLSFAIGANDVANSFGTSLGSGVLTLYQACILGSIFELAGAILIGYRVSDTIRKGIIDVELYNNGSEKQLMVGNVAALTGSCVWLFVATALKLPVSTTHSIVGATVGFSLVAQGAAGINWKKLALIIGSWFISPVLSGVISCITFIGVRFFVLCKEKPLEHGLLLLPLFYFLTAAINLFSVFYKGSSLLHFDKIPLYGVFILTFGLATVVAIVVRFGIVPWYRKSILRYIEKVRAEEAEKGEFMETSRMCIYRKGFTVNTVLYLLLEDAVQDKPETAKLFSFLQILTAVFGAFAHGGNDVSNSIGPLVAIWVIGTEGSALQKTQTPIWILFFGGAGIVVGLFVWGRRVMETVGKDLAKVTPSSGFCIEIGSALTVLLASNIGIPISTTHCKVGSVVCVGRVRSKENVDWKLFRNIVFAWVLTLPVAGCVSALAMFGFGYLI
ncbi:hypothetical protein FSP39_019177 [Pinctada imbricata]|uniref:Phosphate transporter n=1 Tax=Pinctada imbricata TaxID=66713 RepID=A0AA89BMM6_PINIB|nr:hypothetical protein FSP39_019177 [Pinctada imbricata]